MREHHQGARGFIERARHSSPNTATILRSFFVSLAQPAGRSYFSGAKMPPRFPLHAMETEAWAPLVKRQAKEMCVSFATQCGVQRQGKAAAASSQRRKAAAASVGICGKQVLDFASWLGNSDGLGCLGHRQQPGHDNTNDLQETLPRVAETQETGGIAP